MKEGQAGKITAAIIVAAGRGTRMGDTVRKQYLAIGGQSILGHTLLIFSDCTSVDTICVVVPEDDIEFCRDTILKPLAIKKPVILVPGGPARQDSVYNGLLALGSNADIVVVHDGVRPFVPKNQLPACIDMAKESGACILGIPVYDTIKRVAESGDIEATLDRDILWLAQTPQAFQYRLLIKAHESAREKGYTGTDDASLVERLGGKVNIIEGSRYNIKITSREDFKIARSILSQDLLSG